MMSNREPRQAVRLALSSPAAPRAIPRMNNAGTSETREKQRCQKGGKWIILKKVAKIRKYLHPVTQYFIFLKNYFYFAVRGDDSEVVSKPLCNRAGKQHFWCYWEKPVVFKHFSFNRYKRDF